MVENGKAALETATEVLELDVAVIGTGFAGLYALYKLRNELNLSVQAFDDADGVGGTWYWNRYPGARADTEVTAYCYSFDRELFDSWTWSERYPRQSEILSYLNHVADRFDLRRSITFGATVEEASFDEDAGRWNVMLDNGRRVRCQFLVEGVGLLSSTHFPTFPGQETFEGEVFHTARWPQEGAHFEGQRVGVIGTGSSGVQVITEIAPEAAHLTVFQRHPQYTVPARHGPLDPKVLARVYENYDGYWEGVLRSVTAFGFDESDISAGSVAPEERDAIFEKVWNEGGGFQFMFATFNDIGSSLEANNAATAFVRKKIKELVDDPETAEKLTPHDLYARRPICCDGYYETYNRDNVSLIDVKAHPLIEMTPNGIRTDDAEYELDVIVFATGFDAVTGNYLKIDQRGRGGVSLRDRWAKRPLTHLGMMTADFPNVFMIFGPMGPFTNQPPAHEAQVDWIAEAIQHVLASGQDTIEPTLAAESGWVALCDDIASETLFPKVDSWINGANVPGKPITVMFFMGGMGAYMEQMEQATTGGYQDFIMSSSAQA